MFTMSTCVQTELIVFQVFFYKVLSSGCITSQLPVLLLLIRKALPFMDRTVIVWCPLWCHSLKSFWDGSAHRCLCKQWDFSINHLAQTFDLPVGFEYHISDCYSDTFAWCSSGYVIVIKEQTSALRLFSNSYITLMRQILWETEC